MFRSVSLVTWYAAIAGILFPLSVLALYRLAWPSATKGRVAAAAGMALAWPLVVPMLSFGSVALVRVLQDRATAPREAASVVPAA